MRADLSRRVKALESRQPDNDDTEIRQFLERLSDEELRRCGQIAERTNDYALPLTPEEKTFFDELERKYPRSERTEATTTIGRPLPGLI